MQSHVFFQVTFSWTRFFTNIALKWHCFHVNTSLMACQIAHTCKRFGTCFATNACDGYQGFVVRALLSSVFDDDYLMEYLQKSLILWFKHSPPTLERSIDNCLKNINIEKRVKVGQTFAWDNILFGGNVCRFSENRFLDIQRHRKRPKTCEKCPHLSALANRVFQIFQKRPKTPTSLHQSWGGHKLHGRGGKFRISE